MRSASTPGRRSRPDQAGTAQTQQAQKIQPQTVQRELSRDEISEMVIG